MSDYDPDELERRGQRKGKIPGPIVPTVQWVRRKLGGRD